MAVSQDIFTASRSTQTKIMFKKNSSNLEDIWLKNNGIGVWLYKVGMALRKQKDVLQTN